MEKAARAIEAEFGVALGSEARVAAACAELRAARASWCGPAADSRLEGLAALVVGQTRGVVLPLFDLLEEVARVSPRPWGLLEPMLRAGLPHCVHRALDVVLDAVAEGRLDANGALIRTLASIEEAAGSPLREHSALERIARLLGGTAQQHYLQSPHEPTRRLAARVLDLPGHPPQRMLARAILGDGAHDFLERYLDFTRATHLDLLAIAAGHDGEIPALASLQAAERACGARVLQTAIGALGWPALNLGLDVRRVVGVSIGGGIPLLLSPDEAAFLDGCPHAARVFERTLFAAHGARLEGVEQDSAADATVARFRASNVAHAAALSEFLDLTPLTRERLHRLTSLVGSLVEDFVALFPAEHAECVAVRRAYERLLMRIRDASGADPGPNVSAEVTRLVQPFEDPASADAIGTLHGLKRYLHQRGLRLAFQLIRTGRDATRTIALAVGAGDDIGALVRPIEYADFEPESDPARGDIPYAVRVVVDGFSRQLLLGEERLPSVRAFCYGSEVHYFVSFRNHPAFIRIDYSPPFAGGMIDLEYYGVSKYELSHHPSMGLDAVRACFGRLDYDIDIENTRVHARYDKERARDLSDLCARAEALFRLVPHLMDLDWTLGHLDLPVESRRAAVDAWADVFARWGVLPLRQVLSGDRRSILLRDAPHPAGPRERAWPGTSPYEDRFTPEAGANERAAAWIRDRALSRGLEMPVAFGAGDVAQIPLEQAVLVPLRESDAGAPRPHPARRFAALVAAGGTPLVEAARLGRVVTPLDRSLRFETVGYLNGRAVQQTVLVLPLRRLSIAVLRDDIGLPGLAIAEDQRAREPRLTATAMATILRRHNFSVGDLTDGDIDPGALSRALAAPGRDRKGLRIEGERSIRGVRAAPGLACGLARFGTLRRRPADLAHSTLVADRLSPDDSPFLMNAAAVVCTGGGVLSHAGLLAAQFGIPALVIDACGNTAVDAARPIRFWSVDYEERVSKVGPCDVVERHGFTRREGTLRDGDVVEVSADEGLVRVFGQDRETLALHDGLRQLESAEARLASSVEPQHVLAARGRRAHVVHQLERLLSGVDRADLAAFAARRLLSGSSATACPRLLHTLLTGRAGETARSVVEDWIATLATSVDVTARIAAARIPHATDPFEAVAVWLAAARERTRLRAACLVLQGTGVASIPLSRDASEELSAAGGTRLSVLLSTFVTDLDRAAAAGDQARARHLLDAIRRQQTALGMPSAGNTRLEAAEVSLRRSDRARLSSCATRVVLSPESGGAELRPLIGAKAAGLAEMVRLDAGVSVPPWFVITNAAFQQVLALPAADHGGIPLRDAISATLSNRSLDDGQRSRAIAASWARIGLPSEVEAGIRQAYRELSQAAACAGAPRNQQGELLVAVRSSTLEEDRPEAMRAGEFETYLFVAGEASLLEHVKRAWAGFWTARAIYRRGAEGIGAAQPGGGIIVQRIVDARCAGVLQTINVADGRPWEMAINVAFGLGEGVVSGQAAADHVTVLKPGRSGPALRFRYRIADKRERIVFDTRRGAGTTRVAALYHQGLRPALEYADLEALVLTAGRLERAWCEALDIEFAIDAERLWLLQARPIPAVHAAWREVTRLQPFAAETCHDSPR